MQFTVKAAVFSLIIALFSLSSPAQSKDKKDSRPAGGDAPPAGSSVVNDPELKNLKFPEVAGWQLSERTVYPMEGGGYSVNYDAPGNGRVTVYVYNAGLAEIPNELKGVIEDELDGAKAAIQSAVQAGIYSDVKETKTETITLGGDKGKVKALRANFILSRDGAKMSSSIFMLPYRNNFIKLRITRPVSVDKDLEASYAELMSAIDALFAK